VWNDTSYVDGRGWVNVLGELFNNTGSNQQDVLVTVSFFDNDVQVDEQTAAPVVLVAPQGSKVPFQMDADIRLAYTRYEITVDGVPAEGQVRQDLEILNVSESPGVPYRIAGQLHNPGDALATYAQVIATLYNGEGKVVNVGYDFLPAGSLGPGQTVSFEVIIDQPHEGIAGYELQALGS
jgi:hypothetical protein